MKEIKAIIQPFMLEKVLSTLDAMENLPGVTISEIMGWGRLPERREVHDVHHAGHGLSKKVKLELVVRDEQAQVVVDAITTAAHTGRAGDGKVFVAEILQATRVRTGQTGREAL